jgi:hypothetical protein
MRDQDLAIDLAALAALGVAVFYREEIVNTTKDVVTRGARLTKSTLSDGLVLDAPEDLAAAAETAFGQPLARGEYSRLDVYALTRAARSEAGARDNDISRKVRMHVLINQYLDSSFSSLASLITYSKRADARGFFGEQSDGPRRVATTRDPYAGDVHLAWQVIDERSQGIDLAQGGTNFVDRKSMGKQKGSGTWEALLERWGAQGLEPFQLDYPGLPSDFYLFKKA